MSRLPGAGERSPAMVPPVRPIAHRCSSGVRMPRGRSVYRRRWLADSIISIGGTIEVMDRTADPCIRALGCACPHESLTREKYEANDAHVPPAFRVRPLV